MDVRRLQKTGGASLVVTLPKKWITSNNLHDKDAVEMSIDRELGLVIKPISVKRSLLQSSLSIEGLSSAMLTRELIGHYVSGVDEIIIHSKKILPEQRTKIRSLCGILLGFELLDESSEKIVLKNVFDPTKFSMSQNIEKMFLITTSMLEDAYKALTQHDQVLATDVINRDAEIDKFQIAITRQLYACVRKKVSLHDLGLTELDLFFYQNIATQLERIADHAEKIAKTAGVSDITGTPIRISVVVITTLTHLLYACQEMITTLDIDVAHKILDNSRGIENQIYSKITRKHKASLAWDVLEDSLDRIRGYIMNMAEITIDQAILKIDSP